MIAFIRLRMCVVISHSSFFLSITWSPNRPKDQRSNLNPSGGLRVHIFGRILLFSIVGGFVCVVMSCSPVLHLLGVTAIYPFRLVRSTSVTMIVVNPSDGLVRFF